MTKALNLKLSHAGFEVAVAWNGDEGIKLLQKNTYALILLDVVMPKIDGFAVLEALKEMNITTPVIVLSNLSQEDDMEHAKALGAKEFFIKSNTPITTIVERVAQLLA